MKSIIFSILLLIGGLSCLGDAESFSSGLIAIGIAIAIILIKAYLGNNRGQERATRDYKCQPSSAEDEGYSEYVLQREKYEAVEKKWKTLVDRHYKLMEEIGVAYTVANNLSLPNSAEMECVVNLCKKDIELAEGFKQYWSEHNQAMIRTEFCDSADISNALPNYPSFKRLAIIYERQKRYDEAIAVCQRAIYLGFSNDGTEGQMPGRIARLLRKKGKTAVKLPEADLIVVDE